MLQNSSDGILTGLSFPNNKHKPEHLATIKA
jgi:hypothetical protein